MVRDVGPGGRLAAGHPLPLVVLDLFEQPFGIFLFAQSLLLDNHVIPYAVQIAVVRVAPAGAQEADGDAIASARIAQGMKGLMEVADQMHQELQREGAFLRAQRFVAQPSLEVKYAVGDTVSPR